MPELHFRQLPDRDEAEPAWLVLVRDGDDEAVIGQVVGREQVLGHRELPRRAYNFHYRTRATRGRLYEASPEGADLDDDDRFAVESWLRRKARKKTTRRAAGGELVRAYEGARVALPDPQPVGARH